jgi:hypothetical protein
MHTLPKAIRTKLFRAGFTNLEQVVDYMMVAGNPRPRRYRLCCIPTVGIKTAYIIAARMAQLELIPATRFDK